MWKNESIIDKSCLQHEIKKNQTYLILSLRILKFIGNTQLIKMNKNGNIITKTNIIFQNSSFNQVNVILFYYFLLQFYFFKSATS